MTSPFPGMDPFIENREWEEFHARLNLTFDYRKPLDPPLLDAGAAWAGELIRSGRGNAK